MNLLKSVKVCEKVKEEEMPHSPHQISQKQHIYAPSIMGQIIWKFMCYVESVVLQSMTEI